jgi:hypothetical protein
MYSIGDDPLYEEGEEVLIFVKEYEPGRYRQSGGPSGRFSVINGEVKAIVVDGVKLPAGATIASFAHM